MYGNRNKYKITIIVKESGEILKEDCFSHDEMLKLIDSTRMYGTGITIHISTADSQYVGIIKRRKGDK